MHMFENKSCVPLKTILLFFDWTANSNFIHRCHHTWSVLWLLFSSTQNFKYLGSNISSQIVIRSKLKRNVAPQPVHYLLYIP